MHDDEVVGTAPPNIVQISVPRGWVVLTLALAAWGVVALCAAGVWFVFWLFWRLA